MENYRQSVSVFDTLLTLTLIIDINSDIPRRKSAGQDAIDGKDNFINRKLCLCVCVSLVELLTLILVTGSKPAFQRRKSMRPRKISNAAALRPPDKRVSKQAAERFNQGMEQLF